MHFKVPAKSPQTNETDGTKKIVKRIARGQKLYKDNELLTNSISLYGSREEWVSGWREPGDWFVSEYQIYEKLGMGSFLRVTSSKYSLTTISFLLYEMGIPTGAVQSYAN